MSQLTRSGRNNKFSHPPPVCSIQTLKELDKTHHHWREQPALLSLVIRMLILPGNFLIDTQKCLTKYLQPHEPIKLTRKINHHSPHYL